MQTEEAMNLRTVINKHIKNKKGSYLVEAAITLPILFIAVLCMSSIILMYACIENSNFIAANEIRKGACESIIADTSIGVPFKIKREIEKEHSLVKSVHLTDYGHRVSRWDVDELIAVSLMLNMKSGNPLGLVSEAEYEISMVTRAYVGRFRGDNPMSADEFGSLSDAVFIFPKRGEKYHSEGCRHLRAASTSGTLSPAMKRKYKSCPLCKSGRAASGTLVYYFPAAGEDYHLRGCASLQRNYIEIERQVAMDRGYGACATCGG